MSIAASSIIPVHHFYLFKQVNDLATVPLFSVTEDMVPASTVLSQLLDLRITICYVFFNGLITKVISSGEEDHCVLLSFVTKGHFDQPECFFLLLREASH
uniref:Uncharacterized protein n=1 Tax=Anguilla anguilla TaxID=7936 RepID=A0A0E9PN46_ANGAN